MFPAWSSATPEFDVVQASGPKQSPAHSRQSRQSENEVPLAIRICASRSAKSLSWCDARGRPLLADSGHSQGRCRLGGANVRFRPTRTRQTVDELG